MNKNVLNFVSRCNSEPIKTCIVDDVQKKKKEDVCKWSEKQEIGRGTQGTVYSVCCNDDCNYVVKVVKFEKNDGIKRFIDEAKNQQKYYNEGMAPRVVVACYCVHEGVILMEKVKLLKEYLLENPTVNQSTLIKKYTDKYRNVITKTRVVQNDTNPDNIAIGPNGEPMLIDFGISTPVENEDKIEEHVNDFGLSLKLVFKEKYPKIEDKKVPKIKEEIRKLKAVRRFDTDSDSDSDDVLSSSDEDSDIGLSVPRFRKKKSLLSDESDDNAPLKTVKNKGVKQVKKKLMLDDFPEL